MARKKQTILVTGGAGFIGSHLAQKLLASGYKIVIVDNLNNYYHPGLKKDRLKHFLAGRNFVFSKTDITDFAALKKVFEKYHFDAICHLAAQAGVRHSFANPLLYGQVNVLGTINLLELARQFGVKKFVFASSSSVYGEGQKIPFRESAPLSRPLSFYGATKQTKEALAQMYHRLYGLRVVGLRFFTVYGPWGRPDMAYFKFANLIRQGEPIDVYNFGKMKRDFTYIDDIVEGILAAVENDFDFEIFNLGNNQPVQLEKMISLLEGFLGQKAQRRYLDMQPGEAVATWAEISKAKKMLGFNPKTSVEEGLRNFTDWYKKYYKIKK
jgi:UDP-glucuronate 4-epimerase